MARASACIALPLPYRPSFSNSDVTPPAFPHFRCRLPPPLPSLHLCLSDSLCPSLGPWISVSLGWVSPPTPVLGYVNVVFPVSSAGLPAWLTFNLIHGGASAEPLIKAGRQLGECQGGLGPTGPPGPGTGALGGEGQGPGCNLRLPRGLSILGPESVGWPAAWTAPAKTRLPSAQDPVPLDLQKPLPTPRPQTARGLGICVTTVRWTPGLGPSWDRETVRALS